MRCSLLPCMWPVARACQQAPCAVHAHPYIHPSMRPAIHPSSQPASQPCIQPSSSSIHAHVHTNRMLATASGPHAAAAAATGCSLATGAAGLIEDTEPRAKKAAADGGRASHDSAAAAAEKDGAARRASVDLATQNQRTSALPPVVTYARVRHKYDFAKDCSVQVFNGESGRGVGWEVQTTVCEGWVRDDVCLRTSCCAVIRALLGCASK